MHQHRPLRGVAALASAVLLSLSIGSASAGGDRAAEARALNGSVYLADIGTDTVHVVQVKWKGKKITPKLKKIITGFAGPTEISLGAGVALVLNAGNNTLAKIDTDSNTLVETIKLPKDARSVATTNDGRHGLVAHGKRFVSIIDVESMSVIDRLKVGKLPWRVRIGPFDRVAATINVGANTISGIDLDAVLPADTDDAAEAAPTRPQKATGISTIKNGVCDLSGGLDIGFYDFLGWVFWTCGTNPTKNSRSPRAELELEDEDDFQGDAFSFAVLDGKLFGLGEGVQLSWPVDGDYKFNKIFLYPGMKGKIAELPGEIIFRVDLPGDEIGAHAYGPWWGTDTLVRGAMPLSHNVWAYEDVVKILNPSCDAVDALGNCDQKQFTGPDAGTYKFVGPDTEFSSADSSMACTYKLAPLSFSFPKTGGTATLSVVAPEHCAWALHAIVSTTYPSVTLGPNKATFVLGIGSGTIKIGAAAVSSYIFDSSLGFVGQDFFERIPVAWRR